MADTTPAHLFIPDVQPDTDFAIYGEDGALLDAGHDHRRVMARCNRGYGISFGTLHDVLIRDPYTYGIVSEGDQMKLGTILASLVASGDLAQLDGGLFEATDQGWEKVTHHEANTGEPA